METQVRDDGSLGQGRGRKNKEKATDREQFWVQNTQGFGGGGGRSRLRSVTTWPCQLVPLLTFSLSVQIWMALGINLAVFSFFKHVTSFS